jgi:hypothetical protein
MLALVKKPHIELSIHGEQADELRAWIRKKYDLAVLANEPDDDLVSIESTDSDAMARRLSTVLKVKEEHLKYGGKQEGRGREQVSV